MKICYIADPDVIITIRYLQYFINSGHEVHLISSKIHSFDVELVGDELKGAHIHQIPEYNKNDNVIFILPKIKKIIKNINPNLIHIHNLTNLGMAAAQVSNNIPVVLTPWGADLLVGPQVRFRRNILVRFTMLKIDALISGSLHMLNYGVKYGIDPQKCHLITMGIDTKQFTPNIDTSLLYEKLNISKDKQIILVPRQWSIKQNTEKILRSVPLVLKSKPNTVFIFKNVFGSLGPELKSIQEELDLTDSVRLIDRDLPPEESYKELPAYYNIANAVVSVPTWDTGSPATVMEAMSCGSIPIVSPANKQWVRHRENGLIIIPDSPESIAKGIIEVLNMPNWMEKAPSSNRNIICWGGDYYKNMKEISSIYDGLIRF